MITMLRSTHDSTTEFTRPAPSRLTSHRCCPILGAWAPPGHAVRNTMYPSSVGPSSM
jgi:hypothetical protein